MIVLSIPPDIAMLFMTKKDKYKIIQDGFLVRLCILSVFLAFNFVLDTSLINEPRISIGILTMCSFMLLPELFRVLAWCKNKAVELTMNEGGHE
ncbi:MAG: hypothetical protein AAF429_15970 [Pseudomonadota bacterium]